MIASGGNGKKYPRGISLAERKPVRLKFVRHDGVNPTPNRKVRGMKAKEQFALALRIIGVLGVIYVLRTFVRDLMPSVVLVVIRVVFALVGLYLIRGASFLVDFAYPEAKAETPEKASA